MKIEIKIKCSNCGEEIDIKEAEKLIEKYKQLTEEKPSLSKKTPKYKISKSHKRKIWTKEQENTLRKLYNENKIPSEISKSIPEFSPRQISKKIDQLRLKTNDENLKCPHCKKDFSNRRGLNNHILQKHTLEEEIKNPIKEKFQQNTYIPEENLY